MMMLTMTGVLPFVLPHFLPIKTPSIQTLQPVSGD